MERMMMVEYRREKPGYIALIVLTAVLFIITIFFNFISIIYPDNEIFKTTNANISVKYNLDVTPAGWTFSIWAFIYSAQLIWIIYAHTLICRQNKFQKGKLYYDPPFLPPTFFTIYCMNLIINVTWLLVIDSEYLVAGFITLLGIYVTCILCLFFSFKLLWDYEMEISKVDMWLNIILVQNGLGLYATWTGVATLLNFGFVLRYKTDSVPMDTTCYIILVILLAEFLLYYFADVLVATRRLRYFFAPYLVLIMALSGVIDKNWDSGSGVQIFVVIILGVVILALIGKIVSVIYNARKNPLSIESSD